MKFLVSIPKAVEREGKWTTERKPVVPCFPSQDNGAFLTVPEFKLAYKAEVADITDDPDELAASLAKEYPGLPKTLHANYVLAVFKAVFDKPLGTVYRISVSQSQAMLIDDKTLESNILWDEQPLK